MKLIKAFIVAFMFAATAQIGAFAKSDPVIIKSCDIKKVQKSDIPGRGQWTRAEVVLMGKENPEENPDNKDWIRDVQVTLTLVYAKDKNKDKWDPSNWMAMKSSARLMAVKRNTTASVVFYIPEEAESIYKLRPDMLVFSIIDLSACGVKIELNKNNLKDFLSKEITGKIRNMKQYAKLREDVAKVASSNEGFLIPFNKCPLNVQLFEYGKDKNGQIPTYLSTDQK